MNNAFEGCMSAIAIVIIYVMLLGFPVMLLWNWLMPGIFHLPEIGFWQAVGINLLCSILFKGSNSTSTKK